MARIRKDFRPSTSCIIRQLQLHDLSSSASLPIVLIYGTAAAVAATVAGSSSSSTRAVNRVGLRYVAELTISADATQRLTGVHQQATNCYDITGPHLKDATQLTHKGLESDPHDGT